MSALGHEASLFGSDRQHAPNFSLSAHGAFESVKVADVAFSFDPEHISGTGGAAE